MVGLVYDSVIVFDGAVGQSFNGFIFLLPSGIFVTTIETFNDNVPCAFFLLILSNDFDFLPASRAGIGLGSHLNGSPLIRVNQPMNVLIITYFLPIVNK